MLLFGSLLLSGCSGCTPVDTGGEFQFGGDDSQEADTDTDSDMDTDSDTDTDGDTDSDSDTDTDWPVFDCSKVPDDIVEINDLDKPRGFHDVVFDAKGNLIGSDGNNLTSSPDDDSNDIWMPDVGQVEGLDMLPDGDVIAATGVSVVRINHSTGVSVLASDIYTYGMVLGPKGLAYTTSVNDVIAVDPDTGDSHVVVSLPSDVYPRVADFSPDLGRMYIAAGSKGGLVYAVDLDVEGEPDGDPYVFASGVGEGYPDGLGVDLCGNLYVNEYYSFSFYRVSPHRDVKLLKTFGADLGYAHGQEWGSGLSVWRADAIYGPQPYQDNSVAEIVVGVPSRRFNDGHYKVINAEK